MLRFTLIEDESRQFHVERWCFRGRIDAWISLYSGALAELVAECCPHLGRESFYELI